MPEPDDPKDRGEQHQPPSRSAEEHEREQRRNRRYQDEYDERDDQVNEPMRERPDHAEDDLQQSQFPERERQETTTDA